MLNTKYEWLDKVLLFKSDTNLEKHETNLGRLCYGPFILLVIYCSSLIFNSSINNSLFIINSFDINNTSQFSLAAEVRLGLMAVLELQLLAAVLEPKIAYLVIRIMILPLS